MAYLRALIGTIVLCLSVILLWPPPARAEPLAAEGRWTEPISLSGNDKATGGWFPAIVADQFGQVHVVWNGRAPGRPVASYGQGITVSRLSDSAGWLLYNKWDGQRWIGPREIAAIGLEGDALRAGLTIDDESRLHLVYRGIDLGEAKSRGAENEPVRYANASVTNADLPSAWSKGVPISERTPAYFPDIVTDHRGVLHTLTTEAGGTVQYAVYYRRSTDGGQTWSEPVAIEPTLAVSRWRLQLKVGPNDDLNAVWEVVDPLEPSSRTPVGFVFARSTDGGQSWNRTVFAPDKKDSVYPKIFDGTGWRIQPAVGIDGRGQVVLVWREVGTNLIYYQRSTDGREWTAPARVGGVARGVSKPFDRYDMALDDAGRLHLAMVAYPDGSKSAPMALLHSEWLGYSWGNPETIAIGATAPFPEWPRIAIGEGNRLHVVWFGREDDVPIGIWYSTKTTSAPFIPPLPVPADIVLAPTPVARAGSTTRPAAQPVPTATSVTPRNPALDAPADQLRPASWPLVVGLVGAMTTLVILLGYRSISHRR